MSWFRGFQMTGTTLQHILIYTIPLPLLYFFRDKLTEPAMSEDELRKVPTRNSA